jgi:cytochrome c
MKFSLLECLAASFLIVLWLIWGGWFVANTLVQADPQAPQPTTAGKPKAKAQVKAPQPQAAPKAAVELGENSLEALLAAADPAAGKKAFKRCKACHSTKKDGKNKVGPKLWGVFDRAKASVPGYKYSKAFKALSGEWSYQELDALLTKPKAFLPGNKMTFRGLKRPTRRAALIAYMRSLSDNPRPLP